jgi:hypothetical protein
MGDRHTDLSRAIMLSVDIAGKIEHGETLQSLAVPAGATESGSKMVAMCSRFVPFSASSVCCGGYRNAQSAAEHGSKRLAKHPMLLGGTAMTAW